MTLFKNQSARTILYDGEQVTHGGKQSRHIRHDGEWGKIDKSVNVSSINFGGSW